MRPRISSVAAMRRARTIVVAAGLLASACASEIEAPMPPELRLPSGPVVISTSADTVSFVIRNDGGATLAWSATPAVVWLAVAPAAGVVPAGESTRVTLTADKEPVAVGVTAASITLQTNEFSAATTLQVEVHVPPSPTLSFRGGDTLIAHPQREGEIVIGAGGKGLLTYTATSDADFLLPTYGAEGGMNPGDALGVGFEIVRWPERDTTVHLVIVSNAATTPLRVPIHVLALPAPEYLWLPRSVTDAAFDPSFQRVVVVHGDTLTRIDLETRTMQSMGLPLPALNVDVTFDHAVVGHEGAVTVVRLNTMSVLATVQTGVDAADATIVVNRAFIIPRDAPHARLVHFGFDDFAVDTIDAPDRAPLRHFGAGSYLNASLADGGIVAIDWLDGPSFALWSGNVEFAPGDARMWNSGLRTITSAGRMLTYEPGVAWLVQGRISWAGAADPRVIRWAHQASPTGTPLYFIPVDADGHSPPVIGAWSDEDASSRFHDLPPVEVDGETVPVEPFYVWTVASSDVLVLQRALTAGGNGPWLLGMIAQ